MTPFKNGAFVLANWYQNSLFGVSKLFSWWMIENRLNTGWNYRVHAALGSLYHPPTRSSSTNTIPVTDACYTIYTKFPSQTMANLSICIEASEMRLNWTIVLNLDWIRDPVRIKIGLRSTAGTDSGLNRNSFGIPIGVRSNSAPFFYLCRIRFQCSWKFTSDCCINPPINITIEF